MLCDEALDGFEHFTLLRVCDGSANDTAPVTRAERGPAPWNSYFFLA